MNKEMIRARFIHYRQRITDLIDDYEDQLSSQEYYRSEAVGRAEKRAEECRREGEKARRQEESDRWYREDELRSATKELERVQSYGDPYATSRAIEKIKKLG